MTEVLLSVVSRQQLRGEEPETTKLLTPATLHVEGECAVLRYEETELTGLEGTTTTFRLWPERIELERRGALNSTMVFAAGTEDRSLYDMGFGALLITVRTEKVSVELKKDGGCAAVAYSVAVEGESAGRIEYLLEFGAPQ